MTPPVRVERLTKRYGRARGVEELTFEVAPGEVFGYLGPNGAGKTTTIRLLLDLIRPTSGRVELFGRDPRRNGVAVRRRIGYVPGDLRLYERLTGGELIAYFAHLRGLPGSGDAAALAERLELDLDHPIRALSKGNRQKVGLVQALVHREAVETLRTRAFTRVEVTFAAPPPAGAFDGLPGVRELERRGPIVLFALEGPADPLVKALARHTVVGLDSHEADLEDVFLALYRGGGADAP